MNSMRINMLLCNHTFHMSSVLRHEPIVHVAQGMIFVSLYIHIYHISTGFQYEWDVYVWKSPLLENRSSQFSQIDWFPMLTTRICLSLNTLFSLPTKTVFVTSENLEIGPTGSGETLVLLPYLIFHSSSIQRCCLNLTCLDLLLRDLLFASLRQPQENLIDIALLHLPNLGKVGK